MQWQRALYDYEAVPPPHCWEQVKESVSNEPLALGQSLHDWEAAPPDDAWKQVAVQIQPEEPIHRIPAARTLTQRPIFAYAAVVAGILLLGSVLWYGFNDRENGLNVRDLAAGLSYADSQAKSTPAQEKPAVAQPPSVPSDAPSVASVPNAASAPSGGTSISTLSAPAEEPVAYTPAISVSYADGNYIQLTEPDGDVTRVSYKLDRMVKAMHARNGKTNGTQRQEWNRTLENWTARMAQSTYIPSGGNFFDIAEFVEFLNSGQ
jgi:hypothetical protein